MLTAPRDIYHYAMPACLPALRLGRLLSLVAGAILIALPLQAQTPARGPILFEFPISAREVALGGAPQIGSADPNHLFSSPAMIGSGGFRVSAMPLGDRFSAISMATAFRAFGGGIAVGVRTLDYQDVAGGNTRGGIDPIVTDGPVGYSTQAATLGYTRDYFGFDFGVAGSFFSQRSGARREGGYSVDLGVARQLGDFDLSFTARNLGATTEIDGVEIDPPINLELVAGAYGQQLGPLDLGVAGRVGRRDDEEFVYGGGLEVGYYPIQGRTFIARVGAQNVPDGRASPLTLGGSYLGDSIILEYAYRAVNELESLHVFTIGWR